MENNKQLLYIEDNAHNRRIIRKVLNKFGYQVWEAENGLKGFEMISALKPPLVLLDISLPLMDGMQIAGKVKSIPELEKIPLIALTASAMRGDRERFLEAGCDDYLSKPVGALELINMIEKHYPR